MKPKLAKMILQKKFKIKFLAKMSLYGSVISKKLPNVYKSCPKMISQEKLNILTSLQKLPKNVKDLGKLIVAKGFEKLPKVQQIAQSGHTTCWIANWI